MAGHIDMIRDINDSPRNWRLVVKVVRLWGVPEFNNPRQFRSLELVLSDTEQTRIHLTVKKTLIYRFQKQLSEGVVYTLTTFDVVKSSGEYRPTSHIYKLDATYNTKFIKSDSFIFPNIVYSFTPPADVFKNDFNRDFLIDVVGVLDAVGTEREYEKNGNKTKVITVQLNNNGYFYQFTLFGQYVDELNSFLASGETKNAVVALLFAKSKMFQGKPSIQNSINASKLLFNPELPQNVLQKTTVTTAAESPDGGIRQLQDNHRVKFEEDMLVLTPRATIDHLADSKKGSQFVLLVTVTDIIRHGGWHYTAHTKCNRKAYPADGMYYCRNCVTHVVDVTPRYLLKLEVMDDTGTTTFVLFDQDAIVLLNKSCADLIRSLNQDLDEDTLPKPIEDLKGQVFLFKVEAGNENHGRFEPSYKVKKFTGEDFMLKKFKETTTVTESETIDPLDKGKAVVVDHGVADVAQDLLPRFSESSPAFEIGSTSQSVGPVDLDVDSDETPDNKRANDIDPDSAPKEILKKIKIEKE